MAKVGSKADPETKDIEKYQFGNLILWDTPRLGDGTEIDEHHKEVITELLREEEEDGNALIDLVLAIMEGVNTVSDNYAHNDGEENYNEGIKDSFCASIDYISEYVDKGTKIGSDLLGIPGGIVGAFIGGFVGCVRTVLDDIF